MSTAEKVWEGLEKFHLAAVTTLREQILITLPNTGKHQKAILRAVSDGNAHRLELKNGRLLEHPLKLSPQQIFSATSVTRSQAMELLQPQQETVGVS